MVEFAVPDDTKGSMFWMDAVGSLRDRGVATVTLSSSEMEETHSRAFQMARSAMDRVLSGTSPSFGASDDDDDDDGNSGGNVQRSVDACRSTVFIPPHADSAHATGFHTMGGMSRYNAHREGIVFSDGNLIYQNDDDQNDDKHFLIGSTLVTIQFNESMAAMAKSLHYIADRILSAMEVELQLPPGWFHQRLGPFMTSSQWHMKRFPLTSYERTERGLEVPWSITAVTPGGGGDGESTIQITEDGDMILLPMHTDPSLISVVIHDRLGTNVDGAMGLQYLDRNTNEWTELQGHGHGVATILVGSVLAHLTAGRWPAVRHRVVTPTNFGTTHDSGGATAASKVHTVPRRMAATLFVRPQPTAMLQVPIPSPSLLTATDDSTKKTLKADMTFEMWVKKVAKNYEKANRKEKWTR